jgi:hypothetical protein
MLLVSRTWWCAAFGGKGETTLGGGPAVLDIDRTGAAWAVIAPTDGEWAGFITLARNLGVSTEWELHGIAKGANAWMQVDETTREPRIRVVFEHESGSVYQISSKRGGLEGWSQLRTIAATGSNPFLRKDKATGLSFYLYWQSDSGGTIFLKRSDDDGSSFLETEIPVTTGVPQQTATLDFSLDAERTIELVHTDGTSILSLRSTDNGLTWS